MVLVTAGLAAIPRETLDAARVDGASEWQVLRQVTVPLLRPVVVVILVTMTVNVLKVFDLVLVVAPESAQGPASVVALEMWRSSFDNIGRSSALGVLLLVLTLPGVLYNVHRLRRGER
ncbi:ABC transporter permease subunit [Dactylosporangium darangshiense]